MVLVTGGTGVMGSVLVKRLFEIGEKVRVFTLPGDAAVSRIKEYAAEVICGNLAYAGDVSGLCKGIQTVYHCAGVIIAPDVEYERINVQGTLNLVMAAENSGVKHFIYISSASVVYPKSTAYSRSKRRAEAIVSSMEIPHTIVRPTLVYDKKGGLEFDIFLDYLKKFPVVPFIGDGRAVKRPVFAGDIVDGLVKLCNNAKSFGKIYNFSGAEAVSIIEFARLCLRLMERPKRVIVKLPVWFCHFLAWTMKLIMKNPPLRWPVIAGMTQDADLDPAEAICDIGYNPAAVTNKLSECFPRT